MDARKIIKISGLAVVLAAAALAFTVGKAKAHCDSIDGPVVIDAKAALEAGDVDGVLKWVSAYDEAEIRAAFDRTVKVRAMGDEAKELADLWFFETLVRVHRATEGAPYTGLKPAGTPIAPPVAGAEEALEKGDVDDLANTIGEHAARGISDRFRRAVEAKKEMDDSVEAGRKYVHEYVEFIHYVENLHGAVAGNGHHAD